MWSFKNERWIATGKQEWQSTKTYEATGYVDQTWMEEEVELNSGAVRWKQYRQTYHGPRGPIRLPYTRTVAVAESGNTRSPFLPPPVSI